MKTTRNNNERRKANNNRKPDNNRQTGEYRKPDSNRQSGGEYRKPEDNRRSGEYRKPDDNRRTNEYRKPDNNRRTNEYRKPNDNRQTNEYRKPDDNRRTNEYRRSDDNRRTNEYRKPDDNRRTNEYRKPDDNRRTNEYRKPDGNRQAYEHRKTDDNRRSDDSSPADNHYESDNLRLEGRNAVLEALNHERTIDKILMKKGEVEGTLKVIAAKARERGIVVQEVNKLKLDAMSQSSSHQGVIAVCAAHKYSEISDILQRAKDRGEEPLILILDGITDPHNLGAIIRTADAAGAHGVIIPKNRAAGLTGIVSKAAAGALEHVPVAKVVNISRVLADLKQEGLWIAAADMRGDDMYGAPLDGPLAIVIGGEGGGSGRLVKEKCDFLVKIPMRGKMTSLNASVAAGIVLYEVVRKRQFWGS
jgi:23S rRNA (guanosine2251-2'-O)-methyltransferase